MKAYPKIIRVLTVLLAIALAVVSGFGAFDETIYAREVASLAAQGVGQDLVDLFLVAPLLVISMIIMQRGLKSWTLIFGGSVLYTAYSFVIYALGIHFNVLFLLYCMVLGLSFYLFVVYLFGLQQEPVEEWFRYSPKTVRSVAIYLLLIAAMFGFLWLSDVIPALLTNTIPATVSDYNLLVNPVHVLDLALALPALVITGILIWKRKRIGYILAPILLVFTVILAIALAAMVLVVSRRGVEEDPSIAIIFLILSLISSGFFYLWTKK